MAFVVPRANAALDLAALRDFMSARQMARYKWPEFLAVVDEIPLAGPGKVNRRALRDRAESTAC